MMSLMLMAVGFVSAAHTSDVTVSTNDWLEASTATDFTIRATNPDGGSINRILIYTPAGYSEVACGIAPSGWSLLSDPYADCVYFTTTSRIDSGETEEFVLSATTSSDTGDEWLVTTVDTAGGDDNNDVTPTGLTISEAIEAAESGDAILVPAGTYDENVVIENKNSIIIDGSAGVTIAPTSGIGFAIKNSDDITITGFTINTVGEDAHGIWVAGTPNSYGDSDNLIIEDNIINIDGYSTGIYAEKVSPSHNGWTISGNTVTVTIGDGLDLHDLSSSEVSGNNIEITNPGSSTNVLWTSELSNLVNLVFTNNIVTGSSGSEVAFVPDFIVEDSNTAITSITITGNTFSEWGSRALRIGARATEVVVNENRFLLEDQTEVLKNEDAADLDAENNWWSTANKDSIKALIVESVEGSVDFTPWWYDATGNLEDETAPVITFSGTPYSGNPSEEISISVVITDESGIVSYAIDWDGVVIEGEDFDENEEPTEIDLTGDNSPTNTYADPYEYTVVVTATDIAGNEAIKTVKVSIFEVPDWEITLKAGEMNFIAIPFTPESTYYKDVLDTLRPNLDRIWSYEYNEDTGENEWLFAKPTTASWSTTNTLSEIVPGRGYIVFVSSDDVLYGYKRTITGNPEDTPVTPASIKLAPEGYNLIGMFGDVTTPINTALSSLTHLGDENQKYWHKVRDKNEAEVTENLEANTAYWLPMINLYDSTSSYRTYYP